MGRIRQTRTLPLRNFPFLSPEMLDAVRYAQAEGRKLGLRIDVTLGSGWPYGGPNTTLEEAAGRLRTVEVAVPANADSVALPGTPAEGDKLIAASLVNGQPKHWDVATAQPLDVKSLHFAPSGTARVALFFYAGHTRQQVKRAAVGAEGYVLDPFSQQAVATHLEKVGGPLVSAFGATPPYAVFSDSLEAYGADWTPDLPSEFRKRQGYDLLPHLPELVAGGTPAAEKVRHDYGRILTELVNENYLIQINDWAKAHGTRFRSQTYGEPAVSFSSQRLPALAEGEGPQWRAFSTLRWATSANHVFGNNVTSGETYTWLHSPVFRATPLDMKAEADIDFIMGENQLIFHGWPYSPPASDLPPGDPGWSLYAAAALNDHNPWHPVMPTVTNYIARISYLLRQGQPANQVAVLLPTDDAWASFSPGKVTVTGAMEKLVPRELMAAILSAGYNVDFIDADAVNSVGLGTHQILVLPPTDRIPVETLRKISAWTSREGQVICVDRCPSIDPAGKPLPGMTGYFIVARDTAEIAKALNSAAKPDLSISDADDATRAQIGFIRRKLPNSDIYYVVNTSNRTIEATIGFATRYRNGLELNPETGKADARSAEAKDLHVMLAPYESRAYVFGDGISPPAPQPKMGSQTVAGVSQDLSQDWKLTFTGTGKSTTEHMLTDWSASPDTLHYSGEVSYTRDFTLSTLPRGPLFLAVDGGTPEPGDPNSPAEENRVLGPDGLPNPLVTRTGPGMQAYFDPPVREAALVFINGQPAGALWHPPYRLDVTKLLKAGRNHIEIRVYNTALNAWSAAPPRNYKPLIAKYGDRFQMQDLDKVKPLPSGILGPIHLVSEEAQ